MGIRNRLRWGVSLAPLASIKDKARQRITLVVATITFAATVVGGIAAYKGLSTPSAAPSVTGIVSTIEKCTRPCLLARLGEAREGGGEESLQLEAIFIYYRSTIVLANEETVPFVISRISVFMGEPKRYEEAVAWLPARQVDVSEQVGEYFDLGLSIQQDHANMPLSLKPGDTASFEFGGLFPAAPAFAEHIKECINSNIVSDRISPKRFSAPEPADYVKWYVVPPDPCIISSSVVPSGIVRNKKERSEVYHYNNDYSKISNFVKIEIIGGGAQYFAVKRRFTASTFEAFGSVQQ